MPRTNRFFSGLVSASVLVLVLTGCSVTSSSNTGSSSDGSSSGSSQKTAPSEAMPWGDFSSTTPPANSLDGGLQEGTGPNQIDIWVDFQCSHCQEFEKVNGGYIAGLVESNAATVRVHPLYFMDKKLTSNASIQAANAASCVANISPSSILGFSAAVFELPAGSWDPAKLLSTASSFGVAGAETCIQKGEFAGWISAEQDKAFTGPIAASDKLAQVTGTPTIVVNGAVYKGDLIDNSVFTAFFVANAL